MIGKIKKTGKSSFNYITILAIVLIGICLPLSGCATFNDDPWEDFNRPMHSLNDALDTGFLKPSAQFYQDVTPTGFRNVVNNFFDNLDEPYSMVNSLLQGQFANAGKNFGRFVINSTIGLLGLFDVAGNNLGIKATKEDFGQTLGYWGVNTGPYLVVPLFGPSNLRDTITKFGVDNRYNILPQKIEPEGNAYYFYKYFQAVRARERHLDSEKLSQGMSLDKYIFYRTVARQSRINQVYNGNPPKMINKEEDESWLDEQ